MADILHPADTLHPAETHPGFEAELRIPLEPVLVTLAVLGVALVFVSGTPFRFLVRFELAALAMLFYAASIGAWLLGKWKSLTGRWMAIVATIAIVCLGSAWLGTPWLLTWLVVPTALAAALIGVPAAGMTTVGEAILLLLAWKNLAMGTDRVAYLLALAAVLAIFGIVYALYQPVRRVMEWSWQRYQQAQVWLQAAGDRQVELKQVLEDLANANLQLTRLNVLAQRLRQEAEDARQAKEQFVSMVSHELRTPLNMIIGFSEMIVQSPDIYGQDIPPKLLADLDVVLKNSRHLSRLIDDVLDLSQIEAKQVALTKERVALQEIVDTAVVAVRPLFESKKLYLSVEIAPELPPIFCDPTRIRQVLINLLSNAGRFTRQGGVCLRAWREGPLAVLSVADTGPGLSPEAMERLFQPFQQEDVSIRRRYGGTGLGLSICKEFVELHEGRIWAESEQGVGTTFFFELLIDPPIPLSSGVSRWFSPYLHYDRPARRSRAPLPVVRPRFLVLESGNALQRLLSRYLDGVEIVPVTDPDQAIHELARTPAQALLINDLSPGEVFRALDGSISLPLGVPVIGCYVPGIQDSADSLGVSDYLVKPVSRSDLLAALDQLSLDGKTVLLVDDEPDSLRLFRRMLTSSGRGYRVLSAADGQEAMQVLRKQCPDVVLLDLIMPRMDGFQFLAEKRQDALLDDIPVIVLSARDPMGQPIVSNSLLVAQKDGLSVPQVLACIDAITGILSAARRTADPALPEEFAG